MNVFIYVLQSDISLKNGGNKMSEKKMENKDELLDSKLDLEDLESVNGGMGWLDRDGNKTLMRSLVEKY